MTNVIRNLLVAGAVVVGGLSVGQAAQASPFDVFEAGLEFEVADFEVTVDAEDLIETVDYTVGPGAGDDDLEEEDDEDDDEAEEEELEEEDDDEGDDDEE